MNKHTWLIRFGVIALVMMIAGLPAWAQDEEQSLEEQFQQGQGLVEQGKMTEAIEVFRDLTEADEEFGPAWFFLGYTLHMDGQLKEAIEVHQKAAGFDQFTGIATYNLGCAYALTNRKDAAIKALQQAVENGFDDLDQIETDEDLYSLHTDVRFAKLMAELDGNEDVAEQMDDAENYLGQGDFAKAAQVYTAILEDDSRNAFATYRLGYSLHGAGDLDMAMKMHKKATRFDGVAPIATYNIACVHSLKDEKDEAFDSLKKAVDMGFIRLDALENDPDLENIRSDDRFEKLITEIKSMQSAGQKKKMKKDKDHDDE